MEPGLPFLPYGRQSIDEDDIAAVARALRGDFLTTGPTVEAFEAAFADRVGSADAVACSNGTAALHLAMLALGIGPGDICIVPSVTFLATANCAAYVGAQVVFADVDCVNSQSIGKDGLFDKVPQDLSCGFGSSVVLERHVAEGVEPEFDVVDFCRHTCSQLCRGEVIP